MQENQILHNTAESFLAKNPCDFTSNGKPAGSQCHALQELHNQEQAGSCDHPPLEPQQNSPACSIKILEEYCFKHDKKILVKKGKLAGILNNEKR
ncbi:hypothetical protein KY346_05590 [Candidatus Woesearchaeota archaeon]|nr:hypothetical protein [Candidatus Woesearchaeota archaeon]